jgi:hypothetical protein
LTIGGKVINNQFRHNLSRLIGTAHLPANINDAVNIATNPAIGPQVVDAYVDAFRLGFRILAGIAAFQFVLCLGLKKVVLADELPAAVAQGGEEYQMDDKPVVGESKVRVGVDEAPVVVVGA